MTKIALNTFNFENSVEEENLYHRPAEDGAHDVIRYFPDEDLYNICIGDNTYDFIGAKQLMSILTR